MNWMFIFFIFFLSSKIIYANEVNNLIQVNFFSEAKSLSLGDKTNIICEVKLKEGWHIYSKDAGESGYPTSIKWKLPKGVYIEDTTFPKHIIYETDGIKSFIHKGNFVIQNKLHLDSDSNFENNTVLVEGAFSALVCSIENCIPYDQSFQVKIPISSQTIFDEEVKKKLNSFQSSVPSTVSQVKGNYTEVEPDLNQLFLMFGLILISMGIWIFGKSVGSNNRTLLTKSFRIFALLAILLGFWLGYPMEKVPQSNQIEWVKWSHEKVESLREEGRGVFIDFTARWCASCQVNKRIYKKDKIIEKFKDLDIVALQADWTKRGSDILKELQSYGREGVPLYVYHPPKKYSDQDEDSVLLPEILTEKIVLDVLDGKKINSQSDDNSFWAVLGFAFIGGVVLNLMPCVFPVIGLKILSFVKQAGEDPVKIRLHGFVFTFGVVLSFWVLVGLLLFLRERLGNDIGWGFQLQEPVFVFILAVFLLIFALNLSGVFEIGLFMTGIGGHLTQKNGYIGSFFSGFLATIVATPCMAPFLGVAVGAALSMEWFSSIAVFTSIAMGLSTPYLVLSVFPKWISRLPKPGQWMDNLKQAMAFPLYGTVAWLIWTLDSLI